MEKVCPVCNKLKTLKYSCDKCGGELIDRGIFMNIWILIV